MSRPFQREYTDEQVTAIVYAQVDHKPNLTARAAVEAAQRGELPGYTGGPFTIKISTARTYASRERQRRRTVKTARITDSPSAALDDVITEAIALARAELGKMAQLQKRGKFDVPRFVQLAKGLKELRAIAPAEFNSTADPSQSQDASDDGDGLAATMLKDHRAAERGTTINKGQPAEPDGDTWPLRQARLPGNGASSPTEDTDTGPDDIEPETTTEQEPEGFAPHARGSRAASMGSGARAAAELRAELGR